MAVFQRWKIEIKPKFYPTCSCICPICVNFLKRFPIIRSPLNRPCKVHTHSYKMRILMQIFDIEQSFRQVVKIVQNFGHNLPKTWAIFGEKNKPN